MKKYASDPSISTQTVRDVPVAAEPPVVDRRLDTPVDPRSELDPPPSHDVAPQASTSSDDNLAGMLTDSDDGD